MVREYDFKCPACGFVTTCDRHDANPHHLHGDGGEIKVAMKRVYNLGGIMFKGPGFYKNERKSQPSVDVKVSGGGPK